MRIGFAFALSVVLAFGLSSCQLQPGLQQENDELRQEIADLLERIDQLESATPVGRAPLTKIQSFTVGLAASDSDFDNEAFLSLLMHSLKSSAENNNFKVSPEGNETESTKVRGMLVQQYLAAEEVPIEIFNLKYKLSQDGNDFKIGEQIVPASSLETSRRGGAVFASFKGELSAVMSRNSQGDYFVTYEELGGGGGGSIPVPVRDVEIMDAESGSRSARQGDISFNWRVNLEKVAVYRVSNFQGDVGKFARLMRYPGIPSSISRYQTLRDFVFLFGYGNYETGLVQQILTPPFVSQVEVMQIDEALFEQLQGGIPESEILELLGRRAQWKPCNFVDFSRGNRVWDRPASVGFPFVSRQRSEAKLRVFYTKYDVNGPILIGEFELQN